jgi:hypothetical protein
VAGMVRWLSCLTGTIIGCIGSLNMHYAEAPNQAFIRKLPPECWTWQANRLLNCGLL